MKKQKFPPGWNEKRVKEVMWHYESQTEEEEYEEIEALKAKNVTIMDIPTELVPKVRHFWLANGARRVQSGDHFGYDISVHRHRFSVWAAARATQRGFCGVDILRTALECCEVAEFLKTANLDDINATGFDEFHRKWCQSIFDFLERAGISKVTFGRAAKLVSIYLKSVVVLGPDAGTALARVCHPPIDSILLRGLAASQLESEHKRNWAKTRWTNLNEEDYYELIRQLRQILGPAEPFSMLERYWDVTPRRCE